MPEGLRDFRTIIREAEENVGSKYVNQPLDCLWVMENAMRDFFILAEGQKGTLCPRSMSTRMRDAGGRS